MILKKAPEDKYFNIVINTKLKKKSFYRLNNTNYYFVILVWVYNLLSKHIY